MLSPGKHSGPCWQICLCPPIPIGDVTPEERESPVLLSALDASGKVLAEHKIAPKV
jgi:hypothetical protein